MWDEKLGYGSLLAMWVRVDSNSSIASGERGLPSAPFLDDASPALIAAALFVVALLAYALLGRRAAACRWKRGRGALLQPLTSSPLVVQAPKETRTSDIAGLV